MSAPTVNKEILAHIGFWAIYMLLPFLKSMARQLEYSPYSDINDLLFGVLVFYSSYYLFSRVGIKWWYFLALGILFTALGFLNFQIHNYIFKGSHQEVFFEHYAIGYITTYCVLAAFAYLLHSIKQTHSHRLHLQNVIREKEKAELAQLKSQINPHFLFNTLHTIYSSSINDKEKTPDLILKLSDNFRYVFSDAHEDKVSLNKEIKHLKDYIYLQEARLGDKVVVKFVEEIDDYEQVVVPLILMTFIENMFKYSSHLKGNQHELQINLSVKKNELKLSCTNPYNIKPNHGEDIDSSSNGIGIKTTKKRLELSYPNRHGLIISRKGGVYRILLVLQLR